MTEAQIKIKPWIGGNWKCNGNLKLNSEIIQNINQTNFSHTDVVIFPTFIHIDGVIQKCNGQWSCGAQNCSITDNGAFTGEISTPMLKEIGIKYVICGHSERRQLYSETSEIVASKVVKVLNSGLKAVVCIGETLEQRNSGSTMDVCKEQLNPVIFKLSDFSNVIIAYEPIWAIGTGVVATPETAEDVHKNLRQFLSEQISASVASTIPIVYGGSVNATNCEALIGQSNIDGFLVGGASLKPEFTTIVKTVDNYYTDK